jgi:RNA recognition motif-containing protein
MANKLYIGGLSYETNDEELKTFFQQAGTVESASVATDKFSGKSRGFGFVEMSSVAEAKEAVSKLNGQTLGDRTLRVEEAKSDGARTGAASGGAGSGRSRW